jgi:hypothetical protein
MFFRLFEWERGDFSFGAVRRQEEHRRWRDHRPARLRSGAADRARERRFLPKNSSGARAVNTVHLGPPGAVTLEVMRQGVTSATRRHATTTFVWWPKGGWLEKILARMRNDVRWSGPVIGPPRKKRCVINSVLFAPPEELQAAHAMVLEKQL